MSGSQQLFSIAAFNFAQPKSCLNRARSQYFSTSRNFNDGDNTPTMSERKKSVSFSEQLEEVYYIESYKSARNKSSDGLKRNKIFFGRAINRTVVNGETEDQK